jgi:hypothetical protein
LLLTVAGDDEDAGALLLLDPAVGLSYCIGYPTGCRLALLPYRELSIKGWVLTKCQQLF